MLRLLLILAISRCRSGLRRREAGEGTVRRPAAAGGARPRADRLLQPRLHGGRRAAAAGRPVLAGDAAVAEPAMGRCRSYVDFIQTLARDAADEGWLAGSPGRRHGAAARRPDADRPRLASDRARRRHLADADAARGGSPRGSARTFRPSTSPSRARTRFMRIAGRRRTGGSSAALRSTRAWSASSSRPASRRSSARRRGRSRLAAARCGPITGTTTISTSGFPARRERPARRSRRRRPATAAARISITGSAPSPTSRRQNRRSRRSR